MTIGDRSPRAESETQSVEKLRLWHRYAATGILAVVFLLLSFLGGMAQRIVAELLPPGSTRIAICVIALAICVGGWAVWRSRRHSSGHAP
ncbi:MAG: hypothetical protein EXR86_04505 [Gammaproteobacteria bacterium]|nr:hypothetical protein [Gammaproteobacteria bacterium]